MNFVKYIGIDVHLATLSIAVLDAAGKLIMEATIETRAATVLDFVRSLQGTLHLAFEEGTHAEWLYELLLPHVAQVVVCNPRELPRHKGEKKSDKIDARQLAEWLRLGHLKPVYHGHGGLRALGELVHSHRTLNGDTTRVMNRLKAVYRARGIACPGARVYSPHFRQAWLDQLREPGAHCRMELLYEQLDALQALRQKAKKWMLAESRKHPAQAVLVSIPSLGPVRVARLMAVMRTPHRFRTKRQLWTYAGLALVTRSSADYKVVQGELTRSRKPVLVLGLNRNHNHTLKAIFKDAAATAMAHPGPLQDFYTSRVQGGMDPELARVTLARKIAAIVLTLWKKGERFNAEHLKPQAA